jgi:hypothetical protein
MRSAESFCSSLRSRTSSPRIESRAPALALLILALALAGARPAGAASGDATAPADSVHAAKGRSPGGAVLRSAIIPGWGQVYNHSYIKAGLALGGVGFFAAKAWNEYQHELDAAAVGDEQARNEYMNLKVNYIWWGAVVYLLQMADAYVDASLSTFDSDFGPEGSALAVPARPELTLAVRVRF